MWPGVSSAGIGQWWPAAGLGSLSVAAQVWDFLKEVTVIFITSTTVWPQVNNREGTNLLLSTENWIKDLLSMAHRRYKEELYKKDLLNPDDHDGVITHLEPESWNVKSSGP